MSLCPVFSVIVPTRNRFATLCDTLRGIQAQTFTDYEVIVIDDGSSEETRGRYPGFWQGLDPRFRLILIGPPDHPGSGPSTARNHGIHAARGRFITFCDDDDFWSAADHLAAAAEAFAADHQAQIYVGNQIGVQDGVVKIIDWLPDVSAFLNDQKTFNGKSYAKVSAMAFIKSRAFPHLNTFIVSREIVEAISGFWRHAYYEEDRDFVLRCIDKVGSLFFRPTAISLHNIPRPLLRENESTKVTQMERWIGRGLVCRHIAMSCKTPEIIRQSFYQHGDTMRYIVTNLNINIMHYVAARISLSALFGRFSLKWLFYTIVNNMFSLFKVLVGVAGNAATSAGRSEILSGDNIGSPFFSIIVPTRNRLQMLAVTLEGIHSQTFTDYEVIVIDDGSTEEVRGGYPQLWAQLDDRFRLVTLGPPGHPGSGPSAARNNGIAAARGRFVTFCDDDDYWISADHLAAAAHSLSQTSARMYVGNQKGLVDGIDTLPDWLPDLTNLLRRRRRVDGSDVYKLLQKDLILSRAFPHLNILIVRRDVVESIGGFWKRAPYEGDLDFFWRCLDKVDTVLFRSKIVSAHNIPDQKKTDNVSTQVTQRERWLLRVTNCRHVSTAVSNFWLARKVLAFEGDTLRHLTTDMVESKQIYAALGFAKQALAARFSTKWIGYTMFIHVRWWLSFWGCPEQC